MKLLKSLYEIKSPSLSEQEMIAFLCDWLTSHSIAYTVDEIGNIYVTKGESKTYPCVVSHLDEVHRFRPTDYEVVINKNKLFGMSRHSNTFVGIGADDKNGIWVALKCLESLKNIKVAFFVGEEVGCYGSHECDIKFFEDCRFVLECDRKGAHDVITNIGGTALCSKEFMEAINMESFGYSVVNGLMTDVYELKKRELNISCINISCGYYNAHTSEEMTDFNDLKNCLNFVKNIIRKCKDVYSHDYVKPVFTYPRFSYKGFYETGETLTLKGEKI